MKLNGSITEQVVIKNMLTDRKMDFIKAKKKFETLEVEADHDSSLEMRKKLQDSESELEVKRMDLYDAQRRLNTSKKLVKRLLRRLVKVKREIENWTDFNKIAIIYDEIDAIQRRAVSVSDFDV